MRTSPTAPDAPPAAASRVPSAENARARTRSACPFSAAIHFRSSTDKQVDRLVRADRDPSRVTSNATADTGPLTGTVGLTSESRRSPRLRGRAGRAGRRPRVDPAADHVDLLPRQRVLFVRHARLDAALDRLHEQARRALARDNRVAVLAARDQRVVALQEQAALGGLLVVAVVAAVAQNRADLLKDTPVVRTARTRGARAAQATGRARPDTPRRRRPRTQDASRHAHV